MEIINGVDQDDASGDCTDIDNATIDSSVIGGTTPAAAEFTNVGIYAIRFLEKPKDIIDEPEGTVFQYFAINTSNLKEDDMDYSKANFKVSKQWIEDGRIDNTTIRVRRYFNDTWHPMLINNTGEELEDSPPR